MCVCVYVCVCVRSPDVLGGVPPLGGQLSALRVVDGRVEDGDAHVSVLQGAPRDSQPGEHAKNTPRTRRRRGNAAPYLVDVGVPHLGEEAEGRGGVRVVDRELDIGLSILQSSLGALKHTEVTTRMFRTRGTLLGPDRHVRPSHLHNREMDKVQLHSRSVYFRGIPGRFRHALHGLDSNAQNSFEKTRRRRNMADESRRALIGGPCAPRLRLERSRGSLSAPRGGSSCCGSSGVFVRPCWRVTPRELVVESHGLLRIILGLERGDSPPDMSLSSPPTDPGSVPTRRRSAGPPACLRLFIAPQLLRTSAKLTPKNERLRPGSEGFEQAVRVEEPP
ncbi:hypothetical protein EYF80_061048 [Liparis tanakae]|uniref:Uncharacterized protein n=1 Tax=Liparis tanakae TaxID=230148 RepID=A0A4Z2EIX0_9TELE|nr:hypothetical protein EYF80_061048 [Liparis tanakae]